MIRLQRLRIVIKTNENDYEFDEVFNRGLNLIASDDNTRGKSSVISAIYYALGIEEILGGRNEKVLTNVYKSAIEDGDNSYEVIESGVYLEVYGGDGTITLYRSAKHANRDSKLVTVFFSDLDSIYNKDTTIEDYYVNMKGAAKYSKGFHTFMEKFIGLKLPLVPAFDGVDRKLYLQLVFSAFFIEQKKGWSSIYSGMPYLGIKDSKKRVTEYILGLNSFEKSRHREELLSREKYCKEKWKDLYEDFLSLQISNQCTVTNLSKNPEIPNVKKEEKIRMVCSFEPEMSVDEWIENIKCKQRKLSTLKPRVLDNYEEIEKKLYDTEDRIEDNTNTQKELIGKIGTLKRIIKRSESSIQILNEDIQNNKDVKKLKKLGSNCNCMIYNDVCPTCHKKIQDTLLDFQQDTNLMNVDETIKHLEAQLELISFAVNNYKDNLEKNVIKLRHIREEKLSLLRLAKALRNDLYTIDDDYSETVVNERMEMERKLWDLQSFMNEANIYLERFSKMREKWKDIIVEKSKISSDGTSDEDKRRLKIFRNNFVKNLRRYNYYSTHNIDNIEISQDGYMPIIDNFDMKFDSSASDNIRAIWAYTIALTQTADKYSNEKPGIMVFDEPAQHSIGADDLKAFLDSVIELNRNNQTIVGITLNSQDVRKTINKLPKENYNMIHLNGRAFKRRDNGKGTC